MAPADAVAVARRALEASYGLALEGLTDDQLATAVSLAGAVPDASDPGWLARVVDRLPIDESWLFRDEGLWTWLRDQAGPALLERAMSLARPLRVLSLGCSSGQEAFSLAILFQELLERGGIPGSAASGFVSVVGVDSSPARIEVARSGLVNAWSVQRTRPEWLRGRVTLEDAAAARYRVDPAVRAMCRFEVGNLVAVAAAGNAALGGFDLVLCRHVLIYFRAAEAERLTAELARGLDGGALLVVSAAEAHLLAGADAVQVVGPLGVGRAGPPPSPPPAPGRARPRVRARLARRAARRPPSAAARGDAASAVEAHVRVALEHAQAGRSTEALREARAALFHDPRHLLSRMLLGQHLIGVDAERGREVLHELLRSVEGLPAEAVVPCADGLSVGQLATAAQLLLARGSR